MFEMRKRDWTNVAVQVLIVALGVYFIWQRQQALVQITTLLSIAIAASGIWGLVLSVINRRQTEFMALLPPALMLVFGVVLFIFREEATGIVPFCVGLWSLLMGVIKGIIAIQYAAAQEPGWWLQIPQAVLRLALGVLILSGMLNLNAIFAVLMGIYLIVFGVFNIVECITIILLNRR